MYLSRIELDTNNRKTMKALACPQLFHGAVASLFSRGERYLWRVDRVGDKLYLLISCHEKPEISSVAGQFGAAPGETLKYDYFLGNIQNDDIWHFRLRANPVINVKQEDGTRGKILAHVTVEQQKNWLLKRSEKNGFSLNEDQFTVVNSEWLSFSKGNDNGRQVTIHAVTFEGFLTVKDADAFRIALTEGIGRGRAYGLGMITVADRQHII